MLEEQYEIFKSRLHQSYKNSVSFEDFLKLLVYLKEFKSLCLNVGYGSYIFALNGKSFLTWYLGKEEICTIAEARNICKNSYFDISQIKDNSSLYSLKSKESQTPQIIKGSSHEYDKYPLYPLLSNS